MKSLDNGDGTLSWKWSEGVLEKRKTRLEVIAETQAAVAQPMAADEDL